MRPWRLGPQNQRGVWLADRPNFVVANRVSALTRPPNGAGTTWPTRTQTDKNCEGF
jgi:hypothetical protein